MKGIYDIAGLAQERKLCSILYVRIHAEVLCIVYKRIFTRNVSRALYERIHQKQIGRYRRLSWNVCTVKDSFTKTIVHKVSMNWKCARENKLFPTRLLTSEDEYKWYWHQMIYFPETMNTISTTNTISPTHSLVKKFASHLLVIS
jgi:hypothetical protein